MYDINMKKAETKVDVDTGASTPVIRIRGTPGEKMSKPTVETRSADSTTTLDYMMLVVLSFGVLSMSLIALGVFRLANAVEAD